MTVAQKILWLGLAGAAGALARYALATAVQRWCGVRFPWGTFVVNVVGCFVFGLVWTLAEERDWIPAGARLVALTGFLGAFTTFSTFAFETGALMREADWAAAAANFAGQNVLGIAALFAGAALGRSV